MATKLPMKLVRCNGMHIFDQLRLEEVLLRLTCTNYCIFNTSGATNGPVVITGLGGKVNELIDTRKTAR